MRMTNYSETELKNRASVWEQRQFDAPQAAGLPAKAAGDSRLLPHVVFGWLCISLENVIETVNSLRGDGSISLEIVEQY